MPRLRVIMLERPDRLDPNTNRYVLWADVPVARQPFYAEPGKVSAWKDATTADNAALASGAVAELVDTLKAPVGASTAQVQGFLQTRHADFQANVTSNNLWTRYGMTWDGTTWVTGGVA
jgi:hypothetical protein